ncbi:hypothetical protein [Paenibacillus abyssi]|uniref:DUF4064 domain-containing protein n=2 Tax=Paenibacillus abyssi TaxID=1340531 RepID=A0A917G7Q0_9BACL|nr:hypothetical protein [Paenibacillus abyssi]GGG26163.1 hypothetical protein GCM10010916_48210 [Paenibacillus abyssi]
MEQDHMQPKDQSAASPAMNPIPPLSNYPHETEAPKKQSGLGIASFIIGIISILGIIAFALTAAAGVSDLVNTNGTIDIEDPEAIEMSTALIVSGIMMFVTLALSFVGLILGIIGLVMKNRRKVFAIIGVVLNGLLVFGFGALIIIGIAMGTGI